MSRRQAVGTCLIVAAVLANAARADGPPVSFRHEVLPLLTKAGCNSGTCHGAAKGKNGFKLSLRGYDPLGDVRELTDDLASRRVNIASPDDSLMLLKPTGGVPHQGGVVMRPGEPYYEIVRNWIANGATLDMRTPRVTGIQVVPQDPIVQRIGGADNGLHQR